MINQILKFSGLQESITNDVSRPTAQGFAGILHFLLYFPECVSFSMRDLTILNNINKVSLFHPKVQEPKIFHMILLLYPIGN